MKLNFLPNLALNSGPYDEVVIDAVSLILKAIQNEAKEIHHVDGTARIYVRNHEIVRSNKSTNVKSVPFTFHVDPAKDGLPGQCMVYFVFCDEKFVHNGHLSLTTHGEACDHAEIFKLICGHLIHQVAFASV